MPIHSIDYLIKDNIVYILETLDSMVLSNLRISRASWESCRWQDFLSEPQSRILSAQLQLAFSHSVSDEFLLAWIEKLFKTSYRGIVFWNLQNTPRSSQNFDLLFKEREYALSIARCRWYSDLSLDDIVLFVDANKDENTAYFVITSKRKVFMYSRYPNTGIEDKQNIEDDNVGVQKDAVHW